MRYVDLTRTVTNGIPVYPGDTPVSLKLVRTIGHDGYTDFRIESGMHSGTHIDSPMHMLLDGKYISDYPIERFTGKACVIDVSGRPVINIERFDLDLITDQKIVFFHTGHSRLWGTESYFTGYPLFDESVADLLIQKKISIFGIDSPSPDKYPFPFHRVLFAEDILIVENLMNLESLIGESGLTVMMLPLKVEADSAAVRVVGVL